MWAYFVGFSCIPELPTSFVGRPCPCTDDLQCVDDVCVAESQSSSGAGGAGAAGSGGGGGAVVVDAHISSSADDAEDRFNNSGIYLAGETLEIGKDHLGLRFVDVRLARPAKITRAYLRAKARSLGAARPVDIFGQASANASEFVDMAGNVKNRPRTAAFAEWSPPPWSADDVVDSPSLVAIVQEIVNLPDWTSGNAIVLLIPGDGMPAQGIYSYDNPADPTHANASEYAPTLHIESEL